MTRPAATCVATYPAYDLANERQVDLLAAGIEALVWYVPTGMEQVYLGTLPVYALMVPAERADEAREIIRLLPDEDHVCLFRCPHCGSEHVAPKSLEDSILTGWWSMVLTLGISTLIGLLHLRIAGAKFRCLDCGAAYRKKP